VDSNRSFTTLRRAGCRLPPDSSKWNGLNPSGKPEARRPAFHVSNGMRSERVPQYAPAVASEAAQKTKPAAANGKTATGQATPLSGRMGKSRLGEQAGDLGRLA